TGDRQSSAKGPTAFFLLFIISSAVRNKYLHCSVPSSPVPSIVPIVPATCENARDHHDLKNEQEKEKVKKNRRREDSRVTRDIIIIIHLTIDWRKKN
ncbi:hypothetical protein BDV38DRAFT_262238, partial [Aspergillus pseudotamarii]